MFSIPSEDLDHVLAHTGGLWDELRGQRVFVTGGTGFFGIWLVESLLWANRKLGLNVRATVLSREPAAFLRKVPQWADFQGVSWHAGRMDRFDFPSGPFSHIIHAAAEPYSPSTEFDRLAAFECNVQGTRRVLEFARHCGAKRLLFTSSGAVYGRQPPEMTHVGEDYAGSPDTTDPAAGYGHGKRVSEFLCSSWARATGLEAKIARCFAFVGPYLPLDKNYAVGNFLRDALGGGPIRVQGDGTPYRSYLHAADLAVWLWTVLMRGQSCRAYNVGSDGDVTIADLAREVAAAVAPRAAVQIAHAPDPRRPPQRYVPAVRRACDELGLRVNIALSEALHRTAAWHRGRTATSNTHAAAEHNPCVLPAGMI